jgi:hypothetical protein
MTRNSWLQVEEDYAAWSAQATLDTLLFSREKLELPDGTKIADAIKQLNLHEMLLDPTGSGLTKQNWLPKELAERIPKKSLMATIWKAMEPPQIAGIQWESFSFFSSPTAQLTFFLLMCSDVVNSLITTGGLTFKLALIDDFREAMAEYQQSQIQSGKGPDHFGGLPSLRQPQWTLGNKQPTQWGWRCIYPKAAEVRDPQHWVRVCLCVFVAASGARLYKLDWWQYFGIVGSLSIGRYNEIVIYGTRKRDFCQGSCLRGAMRCC